MFCPQPLHRLPVAACCLKLPTRCTRTAAHRKPDAAIYRSLAVCGYLCHARNYAGPSTPKQAAGLKHQIESISEKMLRRGAESKTGSSRNALSI